MTTIIRLPWPPAALHPHAKGTWWAKARATRQYRRWAHAAALEARVPCWPTAILRFTYIRPDRRPRDCQNMHGRVKAAIDGIALAMGCDDRLFRCHFPAEFAPETVRGGLVVVEVSDG